MVPALLIRDETEIFSLSWLRMMAERMELRVIGLFFSWIVSKCVVNSSDFFSMLSSKLEAIGSG